MHVKSTVKGVSHTGIDLIICDVSENRTVPVVSPLDVPHWNSRSDMLLPILLSFANYNLQDNGVILVIHGKDRDLEKELDEASDTCDFELVCEWVGGNRLKLSSDQPRQPTVFSLFFTFPPIRFCSCF